MPEATGSNKYVSEKTLQAYTDALKKYLATQEAATKQEIINQIVGPDAITNENLDTLKEIADFIGDNQDVQGTLLDLLGKKAEKTDITYSNTTPVIQAHGGVAVGETFTNMTIKQMFDKILYPYVAPKLTCTTTPSGGVFECGDTKTITTVTANITKGSRDITKIEAFNGSKSLGTVADVKPNGGSQSVTGLSESIITNSTIKVTITDADNKQYSANATAFTFVYPYYWGTLEASETPDEAKVKAMTKVIQAKGTKTFTYNTDNQKMVIAYPKSYGALSKITDPNNFTVTDTFTRTELKITGLDEQAVDYYVYTATGAATNSNFKMTFTH